MKTKHLRRSLRDFQEVLQRRGALSIWRALVVESCKDHVASQIPTAIRRFIGRNDYVGLVNYADSLVAQSYATAGEHFLANQFAALIRKYPFPEDLGFDPEAEACYSFLASEHRCRRYNRKFQLRRTRKGKAVPFEAELSRMRQYIRYVLGDTYVITQILDNCGFGPGANVGVNGNATHVGRKLDTEWTVTPGALHYAHAAVMKHAQFREVLYPGHGGFTDGRSDGALTRFLSNVRIVKYNKIAFVPKTAKTSRSIAVEPSLNSFVQKGVDTVMRRKLLRCGINLTDQTVNQRLAREGSITGSHATIDLRSASDSIATEVVRDLLPPEWFDLLDATRSKEYLYEGVSHKYEKFCSMGNGFCFPLQSLIFTSAVAAVSNFRPGIDFHVYGDDIVVPTEIFESLCRLLNYLGFRVNTKKTFSNGCFRESCGGDYFGGVDVRPYTLDEPLDTLAALYKFLNLSRRSERTSLFFRAAQAYVLRLIPEDLKFWRPHEGPPDSGITVFGDEHLTHHTCRWNIHLQAWECRTLIFLPCRDRKFQPSVGALVYAALSGSASAMPFTLRRKVKTKIGRSVYSGAHATWTPKAH